MARDVIDELSLKIDIDVDKGSSKTISSLARAITKLNTAVANVGNLQKYVRSLNKISPNTINVRGTTGVGQAMGKTVKPKFQEYTDKTASKGELPSIAKNGNKAAEAIKNVAKESKKAKNELKDVDKNADKTSKTFKKLVKSIGRIAFYRAIRMALNQIAKGAVQGLENIRKMDGELDNSLKNLSLAQTSLYNSLGTLLSPIIKTIEPIVTRIADAFANISNKVAEANAALKGETKYTKILTSGTKEWNEQLEKSQGYLLSFDKFEALNQKDNGYTGTIEEDVGISAKDAKSIVAPLESIESAIVAIGSALATIGALNLISKLPVLAMWMKTLSMNVGALNTIMNISMVAGIGLLVFGIVDLVKNWENLDRAGKAIRVMLIALGAALVTFSTLMKISMKSTTGLTTALKLQKIAAGALLTGGILALGAGILSLIQNWKDMGSTAKWLVPILSVLAGVVTALAVGFTIAKGNWVKAVAIGAMVTGAGLGVGSALSAQKFADGGTFEKGTYFLAGEAGAEAVYNTSGGNGGVVNIEQFTTAMYNALSMYGVARSTDVHFGGDVYIDRTKAGQLLESSVYGEGVRVGHFAKR